MKEYPTKAMTQHNFNHQLQQRQQKPHLRYLHNLKVASNQELYNFFFLSGQKYCCSWLATFKKARATI
jgi:hypothetical protein